MSIYGLQAETSKAGQLTTTTTSGALLALTDFFRTPSGLKSLQPGERPHHRQADEQSQPLTASATAVYDSASDHTGLGGRDTLTKVAADWHMHLDILVAAARGKHGLSFWATWNSLQADYDQRLPR
jgi:hypothetical protein